MLLGLPAITAAKLQLLTVEGKDLMPNMFKVLSLDIGLDKAVLPQKMTIAKLLNQTAIEYHHLTPIKHWDFQNLDWHEAKFQC